MLHDVIHKLHVTYIVDHLEDAAANMFYKLLAHTNQLHIEPSVIHLGQAAELDISKRISAHGIEVYHLGLKASPGIAWNLLRLTNLLRQLQPDIVHGWGYYGNLAASLGSKNGTPVLWSIQQTLPALENLPWSLRWALQAGIKLSQSPQRILYNTHASAEQHTAMGYAPNKTLVIANGFDTQFFRPDSYQRETLRHALNIPDDALLIGMTHDPAPQALTLFIQAAKLIMPHQPNVYFVVAGTHAPQRVQALLHTLPYPHRLKVLGQRNDMNEVLNALDICTFVDNSQYYPEHLAEAMACGLPCMAVGAGNITHLLATTGSCLQPEEATPSALAFAWLDWINAGAVWRQELGKRARQRIIQYHGIQDIVATYQQLYRQLYQQTQTSYKNRPSLMSIGSALLG